jgi:hypothetical protein
MKNSRVIPEEPIFKVAALMDDSAQKNSDKQLGMTL